MPIPALKSPVSSESVAAENTTATGQGIRTHFLKPWISCCQKGNSNVFMSQKTSKFFLGSPEGFFSNPHQQHIGPPPRGQQPPGCWIAKVAGRFYPASEA